jgi:hypothetical protein
LKESRGNKIFALACNSLLSPAGKHGSKVFSPVSPMANIFRSSFVKRSPKEEDDSDGEEEVNEDDS